VEAATEAQQWLQALIDGLQSAQLALLRTLHALGLVGDVHGQPAWPWAWRLSGENLLIEFGQARRLAAALAFVAFALLALAVAWAWRRGRWYLLATLPLVAIAVPWPDASALRVPATPASFHVPPGLPTAAGVVRGQALYAQHCVQCHGADGRGQGPQAASLAVWPPNLAGPLLWRRADGDLLWHLQHGLRDAQGRPTMPGFGTQLSDADAWALIDAMKAQAAGEMLRATGQWGRPVRLADAPVQCADGRTRLLSSWRGQRLRLVAMADGAPPPPEDPRLVTVQVRPGDGPVAEGCVARAPEAWQALALVAGTDSPAGLQFIVDRDGYLRARSSPARTGWSDDDLLCRSDAPPTSAAAAAAPADGLGALIARMDAQPVRFAKGGFIH